MSTCSIAKCGLKDRSRGYCNKHYKRWCRYGDPSRIDPRHEHRSDDIALRLAARSERRGTCLVYTGGKPSRSGHRMIAYKGKDRGVHRVAWELAHGPIPPDMCVLHRCDVPDCIDLDHLFLGSVADNNHDRDRKGRHVARRGSKHVRAKLTEWKVQQIRQRRNAGETISALAAEFGVSEKAVWLVVNGQSWRHVQSLEAA